MLFLTTHSVNFSYSTACPYWLTKDTQEHTHMHMLVYVIIWIVVVVQSHITSNSLQPHGMQHAWLSCPSPGFPVPSPSPRGYSNSCPLSQCCHPTISSFVSPFSSCLQSFPALGSFSMNQFFASDGQSIGVSPSASVLSMNIQDWLPLGLTGLISWQPVIYSLNNNSLCICNMLGIECRSGKIRDKSLPSWSVRKEAPPFL